MDTASSCTCSALRQAARHLSRIYDDALSPVGLGVNQFAILGTLQRTGPIGVQDLAKRLVADRSTLGHLLRPLAARGLLTMGVSARDKRQRVIVLSEEGTALLARGRPHWAQAQARFDEIFGAENAAGLRDVLARVAAVPLGATAHREEGP